MSLHLAVAPSGGVLDLVGLGINFPSLFIYPLAEPLEVDTFFVDVFDLEAWADGKGYFSFRSLLFKRAVFVVEILVFGLIQQFSV